MRHKVLYTDKEVISPPESIRIIYEIAMEANTLQPSRTPKLNFAERSCADPRAKVIINAPPEENTRSMLGYMSNTTMKNARSNHQAT